MAKNEAVMMTSTLWLLPISFGPYSARKLFKGFAMADLTA